MAAVNSKRPEFLDFEDRWQLMRDAEVGERAIKLGGTKYLPMPDGFRAQPDRGTAFYKAYQDRAEWPDILVPTLAGMVGLIHRIELQIEGLEEGKPLADLWERCTRDGQPLEVFAQEITAEILRTGRYGILVDVPSDAMPERDLPYFVGFKTETILNWSDNFDFYVLDEGRKEHSKDDEFAWVDVERYRVLRLSAPEDERRPGAAKQYTAQVYTNADAAGAKTPDDEKPVEETNDERGTYTGSTGGLLQEFSPQRRGGKQLEEIPFVVVGPRRVSLQLDPPPLLGVARASLSIFQLDADYRHQMFNSGQETFTIAGDELTIPKYIGSGVVLGLPQGSEAKFVSPSCSGITAHRTAIMDKRAGAVAAGVRLFDTEAKAESGEALRLRGAAQTASILTISRASAAALEKALRYAAMFVGQEPSEITVKPNTEFWEQRLTAQELTALVSAWQAGAFSGETLYWNLQRGEVASSERTFEEERALQDQESLDYPQPAAGVTGPQQQQLPPPQRGNGSAAFANQNVSGGTPSRFVETGANLRINKAQ